MSFESDRFTRGSSLRRGWLLLGLIIGVGSLRVWDVFHLADALQGLAKQLIRLT